MKSFISAKNLGISVLSLGMLMASSVQASQPNIEYLPIQAMITAEKDGVVKIASANGRFEFRGVLIDRWADRQILTLDDARRAMNYIELSGVNLDQEEALMPYKFGSGPKMITVFVDPVCQACATLLDDLPENSEKYTFNVIPVGLLGEESRAIASSLACAKDQAAAKRQLKTKNFVPLELDPSCKLDLITRRMLTAQLLGVNGLPFMIRHDGLVSRGYPKLGLDAWLEG